MELILQSKKETHVYLAKSVPACHLMITCFLFWVSRNSRNTCSVHPSYEHFLETRLCGFFRWEKWENLERKMVIFMLQNVDPKVKCVTLFPSFSTPFSFFLDFWVFTFFTTPSFTVFENHPKCRIWLFLILAFSTNLWPIKSDLSGNTVWPQASGKKSRQNELFLAFLMNFCPLKM